MRTSGRVVVLLVAGVLICAAEVTTRAGQGTPAVRVSAFRLRPPREHGAGPGTGHGAGRVRVRATASGPVVAVSVRGLRRETSYDVRGSENGRVLGRITTDRHGRGRLRADGRGAGAASSVAGFRSVDVVDSATDDCVLEGRWRAVWDYVSIGAERYGDDGGPTATAILSFFASDGEEGLSFQLYLPIDPSRPQAGEIGWGVSVEDAALPFGVSRAADLQGLPFDVVDLNGDVLVNGSLPVMDPLRRMRVWWPAGAGRDAPGGNAGGDIVPGEPEYFLRVHDARAKEPAVLPLEFRYRVDFGK